MKLILSILAIVALAAATALASRDPVPPELVLHGERLTLRGQATLRVGYIFRIYEASLHVGHGTETTSLLDDVPKQLTLTYLRDIKARDLVAVAVEILQSQQDPATLSALRSRLDQINRWYVDVRAGDRYTLSYVPGVGSELALNGQVLGRIEGSDFAAAYFGIWLDPRTKYQEFRSALMALEEKPD